MRAIIRDTRAKLSHNPTSLLIVALGRRLSALRRFERVKQLNNNGI